MPADFRGRHQTAKTVSKRPLSRFWWALVVAGVLLSLATSDATLRSTVIGAVSDAYIQVSTFVALTMALLFIAERIGGFDSVRVMEQHPSLQVPIASLLGALPGCGGAIIVATQYATGRLSFGALLAALTATMGDAAFLLLAQDPAMGFIVFALGAVVGMVTGAIVDTVHGTDFLSSWRRAANPYQGDDSFTAELGPTHIVWLALMVPGIVLGVSEAAQLDLGVSVDGVDLVSALGASGAALAVGMWLFRGGYASASTSYSGDESARTKSWREATQRVVDDTNFVTVWVVAAFLMYEVTVHVFSIDLAAVFAGVAFFIPLIAVLVGFLPGCGPQIVVTSLYLTGALPLAALLGNAISNDGDALFPAIALAPRAAVVATLYSAVPAVFVAYTVVAVTS